MEHWTRLQHCHNQFLREFVGSQWMLKKWSFRCGFVVEVVSEAHEVVLKNDHLSQIVFLYARLFQHFADPIHNDYLLK